jgi:Flp pilus assembly protein TadG
MVEFALALTVLLLATLGAVELALFAHARQVAVGAAQEGARVASAEGRTLAEGERQARALLALGLGERAELFAVAADCAAVAEGRCAAAVVGLRVAGDYPLQVFGRAPLALPVDIEIVMHVEGLRDGP